MKVDPDMCMKTNMQGKNVYTHLQLFTRNLNEFTLFYTLFDARMHIPGVIRARFCNIFPVAS